MEQDSIPHVQVEFFGVPRMRAGCAELTIAAASVADLLSAIRHACPSWMDLQTADGRLAPQYLLSLDGSAFTRDADLLLHDGQRLLLLSADAGG